MLESIRLDDVYEKGSYLTVERLPSGDVEVLIRSEDKAVMVIVDGQEFLHDLTILTTGGYKDDSGKTETDSEPVGCA